MRLMRIIRGPARSGGPSIDGSSACAAGGDADASSASTAAHHRLERVERAKDSEPLSPRQSHLKQRIPALITCSGTGSGYCAYGYSRQGQNLKVVASSDGPLLRWQLGEAWYGEGLSQQ